MLSSSDASRSGSDANAWAFRIGSPEASGPTRGPEFGGILFLRPPDEAAGHAQQEQPDYFADLNLDQVVASLTIGKKEYNLAPFFYAPLRSREEIEYRQNVMRDLEAPPRFDAIVEFAEAMASVREKLTQSGKLYYKYQKEAWLLDAAELYCQSIRELARRLQASQPASMGLRGFVAFLAEYTHSTSFTRLAAEIEGLRSRLGSIRYMLQIGNSAITVSDYHDEPDYGVEIEADFEKFKQASAADVVFKFNEFVPMNHIEAGVLDRVARLNPEIFAELDFFAERHADFIRSVIARFDREAQFYVAYISHMRRLAEAGLRFCYPEVSPDSKEIRAEGACDIALARVLSDKKTPIVTNDFHLTGHERIIIVSGPNQGGKTTFARMFGQMHHLAAIGCPVPAREARLFLFDRLFTHFERGEDIHNLRGKLRDDLFRLRQTLSAATSSSVVILNEVFNSTSLKDAIFLSTEVLRRIVERDSICVCVTFIDELAKLSDTTVSMASQVKPGAAAERTFKVVRQPLDGLAYAISVAEKYRLTYDLLRRRLAP